MFWAIIETIEYVYTKKIGFFLVFFITCTIFFVVKYYWYKQYRQPDGSYNKPVSIAVAVYKEKPYLFEKCLLTVKTEARKDDELIVVLDGYNKELACIAKKYADKLYILPHAGKRNALSYGITSASNEIVVTIDSDTFFEADCISNLIKPFSNGRIGAVGANQRIFDSDKSLIRTFANLFEIAVHEFVQLGESARGHVGCLFGRCGAFRKEILLPYMDYYRNETFMGIKCAGSDDRLLTDCVIKQGYQTVLRKDAMCYTDCPDTWKSYIAQQRRWQNGSQRSTINRFTWLLCGSKFTAFSFVFYIILPFWVIVVWLNWGYLAWAGDYWLGLPLEIHIIMALSGAVITWCVRRYFVFGKARLHQVLMWFFWMGIIMVIIAAYSFIEIFAKKELATQWRTK